MVLVCGLGSLGQLCLQRLLAFGVELHALDRVTPLWREPELEDHLRGCLTVGDMRLPWVLRRAGVQAAQAVLLLTSDSSANIEAALQVRLLNPKARIVVRSGGHQTGLGSLLEDRLAGITVVDPTLLCAGAIATALRPPDEPLQLEADGETLLLLNKPQTDQRWQKPLRLGGGCMERPQLYLSPRVLHVRAAQMALRGRPSSLERHLRQSVLEPLARTWRRFSRQQQYTGILLIAMVLFGVVQFAHRSGWKQAVFVMLALLKGEYVDAVSILTPVSAGTEQVSAWLIGGTLVYALLGTLITSALVAAILERLLRDRLGHARPRLPRHPRQPALLVGGDALAEVVTQTLARRRRTVVRVAAQGGSPLHGSCLSFAQLQEALAALEETPLAAAGFLSPDLLENLQQALVCQRRWPAARMVVLAHAFAAADPLGDLLGGLGVVSAVDLVADAVVTTAFGERVEGVIRVLEQTLLLVRFQLTAEDTLCGRSIARVENGYGVTVLSLQRQQQHDKVVLPGPDLMLGAGDGLLVLATAPSLRRIELGQISPPVAELVIRCPSTIGQEARFQIRQTLARWLGCAPGDFNTWLDGGSHLTPPLDGEIRDLLHQDLRRLGVTCESLPVRFDPLPDEHH